MEADMTGIDPVAWVRRHPDWTLTTEFLSHAAMEPIRKRSGAWVPLFTRAQIEQVVQTALQARARLPVSPPSVSVDEDLLAALRSQMHYPECWDTACYATFADALHEALQGKGCSTCDVTLNLATDPAKSAEHALQELADESQRLGLYDTEHARAVVEKTCQWRGQSNSSGTYMIRQCNGYATSIMAMDRLTHCPSCNGRIIGGGK